MKIWIIDIFEKVENFDQLSMQPVYLTLIVSLETVLRHIPQK